DAERVVVVPDALHDGTTARESVVVHRMVAEPEVSHHPVVRELDAVERILFEIGSIAVVVELLLSAVAQKRRAIKTARLEPLPREIAVHPPIVDAADDREVIHLEARAAPV